MITIDLENCYQPISATISQNLSVMEFYSPQRGGYDELIRVEIRPYPDEFLISVYNLAMGSVNERNEINDRIRLKHIDSNKVFSTVIFFSLAFLKEYPELIIGLDGSDDLRANLYHSMFVTNKQRLSEFFISIGVDWYVKLLRNQMDIERNKDGAPLFKPRPERFDYNRRRDDLYRYYMFQLNLSR